MRYGINQVKYRKFITIALVVATLLLIYNLVAGSGIFPDFISMFFRKGISTVDTIIIVKEIKEIQELFTQSCYDEILFNSRIIDGNIFKGNQQLILIARGYVKAGFDLKELSEKNIKLRDKTITLHLPPPAILGVVSNPNDQTIIISEKNIQDEINMFNGMINIMLKENAIRAGILERSAEQGKKVLSRLLNFLDIGDFVIEIDKQDSYEILKKLSAKYRNLNEMQTMDIRMKISFEKGSILGDRTLHLRKIIKSGTDGSEYQCTDGRDIFFRLKIRSGKPELIESDMDYSKLIQMASIINAFDFYELLMNSENYIFHDLGEVILGSQAHPVEYRVILAVFPAGGSDTWKKLYISKNTGLIEYMELPIDFNGTQTTTITGFSYEKIDKKYTIPVPRIRNTYVEGFKLAQAAIETVKYR
jgi:hypothetical protein